MQNLTTERLLLREWRESDADDLFEYASRSDVADAAGWRVHRDIDQSRRAIKNVLAPSCLAVELREQHKVIGNIGAYRTSLCRELRSLYSLEAGYSFNPDYWGNGYAGEALSAVLREVFSSRLAQLVWCGYFAGNERSRRLLERFCFTECFTRTETLEKLGGRTVEEVFCILTDDVFNEKFARS